MVMRVVFCLGLLLSLPLWARADDPPSPVVLAEQARRCRDLLKSSIIDFYLPAALDGVNGGYFETLARRQIRRHGREVSRLASTSTLVFQHSHD